MIDPHMHCRDGRQAYKETITHVFEVCRAQGVQKIFDMPNTDPPLLSKKAVMARLKLVPRQHKKDYYLYMGASADPRQLEEAVACYRTIPQVIGFKLYAGKSTGDLAVVDLEAQRRVYITLARLGYRGVLVVHCEKESLMGSGFDPARPLTHARARPPKAEIESVKDQIRLAREAKFRGTLHVAHVSCPESVALVDAARPMMKITCGVTPHHIIWDDRELSRPDGLFYKCNPPLRDAARVRRLRALLKAGKIDWIETDHAPHAFGEKFGPPYASGYPALYLYAYLRDTVMPRLGMTPSQIRAVVYSNIVRAFRPKLK